MLPRQWLVRIAVVACLAMVPAVSFAAVFTFDASGTNSSGNPVWATATFTTSSNLITIVVQNLQTDGAIANQAISGVNFSITGSPQAPVNLTGTSQRVDIDENGTFVLGSVNSYATTRWHMTSLSGGMTALGGGQPDEMIIGGEIGTYSANGGTPNFNPYLYKQATFTLSFGGGVSSATSISNVVFQWGTSSEEYTLPGTPSELPQGAPDLVPEPVSMALWSGFSLLGLAGAGFRRRRTS